MRNLVLGACLVGGLWVASGNWTAVDLWAGPQAGSLPVGSQGSELITWTTPAGEHRQLLTVVDPRTRTLCVYHVELSTGLVTLRSVRNIHFDLQMVEFNGQDPTPKQIRSLLEQR